MRQSKIISLLLENEYLSAKELGYILRVSDRTIRNDIKQINENSKKDIIKLFRGKGFYIADKKSIKNIESSKNFLNDDTIEWLIIYKILNYKNIDYYLLAEDLYISDTQLNRIIDKINRIMSIKYRKNPIYKNKGVLCFDCNEIQKRDYYVTYIIQKNYNKYFNFENYQKFFTIVSLEKLRKCFYHKLRYDNLYDVTFMSFVLKIAVFLERISKKNFVNQSSLYTKISDETINLIKHIENEMEIKIPEFEYPYFQTLIKNDFYLIDNLNEKYIDNMLKSILSEIHLEYGYDFSDNNDFIKEMEAQIHGSIQRVKNEQYIINPVLSQIKSKYALEYDMAIFFVDRLNKIANIEVNEEEIGQFAVHFIWAIEDIFAKTEQKIVLINPFGKQFDELIHKRILKNTRIKIKIVNQYSIFDYPSIMPNEISLVLATTPLPKNIINKDVFLCKNFLDFSEMQKLLEVLQQKQYLSKKNNFIHLFHNSLFFTDKEFYSKKQVLKFMCRALESEGYVDETFYQSVIQREQLSQTSFEEGFVFAHAIKNNAKKTAICTCILKNKLHWGGHFVKIIFLFALSSSWDYKSMPLYNTLVDNLLKENTIHKIGKAQNFFEFINLIDI